VDYGQPDPLKRLNFPEGPLSPYIPILGQIKWTASDSGARPQDMGITDHISLAPVASNGFRQTGCQRQVRPRRAVACGTCLKLRVQSRLRTQQP
jgi:hypothetical protein